ncbi:hypothetical protein DWG14_06081 [Streptomyces griseorubiginosus]|uniref:Asparaginase n=1 Tax=Streptomyces griseorubiginosus TaxID=67304 RepID=A0AAI8L538_9ACTN|nr:hypothetical protein DWG14_06081 [Streptomyces griseorubiginosus]
MVAGEGDGKTLTPMRSVGKPFQLAALFDGPMAASQYDSAQITLMASSHNGEQEHVAVLAGMLAKHGIAESALLCGTHPPYRSWVERRPLTNNCSGKHIAMLVGARNLGHSVTDYPSADHPIQVEIINSIQRTLQAPGAPVGIDGCGVPTIAVSLEQLAIGYAKLAEGVTDSLACIRDSYLQAPFFIGGTDRIESHLIRIFNFVAKSGSDGVWAVAIPSLKLGISLKIMSGNENAASIVMLHILENLGILRIPADAEFKRILDWDKRDCNGNVAGHFEAHVTGGVK